MSLLVGIERHQYAPELNTAILKNGSRFSCPGLTSVKDVREHYFKPCTPGKYAVIEYINNDMPSLNRTYSGKCGNGYKSIQTMMMALKKRHNMGGYFNIKITTV